MSTFIGSVQGTDNLALATGYGILDRAFRRELGMKFPKHKALSVFRELEGRMEPIKMTPEHSFYFYEEGNWFNAAVTIAAVDNGTPGQTTITLSADDHQDSGAKSWPLLNDTALFENEAFGFVIARNRSVANAHTVTIKNFNASQDVQAAALVGTKVVFGGNLFGEESDTPETHVPAFSKITNGIHTSRKAYKVTDWSAQNQTEFEYNGQKYVYVKGLDELADQFAMKEEFNLLLTPLAASLTDPTDSSALKSTTGLIPQITDNGQSIEYLDEPDLAFYQNTVLTIDDNFGDEEYFIGQGRNHSLETINWLVDFTKGGDNRISFNAFDGGREQALKFEFTSIALGGVTLHFDTWPIMSHKTSLGAGDMPYRYMAIMIPSGMGLDEYRNPAPYMRICYSEPQGAAFEVQGDIKVFEHGGSSKRGATTGKQSRIVEMISYKGLEIRNREKFIIARKGNP